MTPQPVAAANIAVTKLILTDFRCYESLRLDLDTRPVVLTGPNGAGKTNLLEAVSFLAPGRGLRRAQLSEIGRRESGVDPDGHDKAAIPWAVAATVTVDGESVEIGTGVVAVPPGVNQTNRRVVRIDGADAPSQSALGEWVHAIWLTPDMDRLFSEGASERRRFIDRLVFGFDAAHAESLSGYERSMRERTRLLRDSRAGRGADPSWLGALEDRMARAGVAVAAARLAFVARMNVACKLGVGPFPAADLRIDGEIETLLETLPALDAEDRVRDHLAANRARDTEAGRATFGAHRSDLICRHVAKNIAARQCSTGEQKALLISIVLANMRLQALERGIAPILLFDEIAAHLDEERREALFDEICASGAQAWMTGTDEALFAPLADRASYFRVSDAQLNTLPHLNSLPHFNSLQ
jgi:DNA replication and repair protein RecF